MELGTLFAIIGADTSPLTRAQQQANATLESIDAKLEQTAATAQRLFLTALGGATVAAAAKGLIDAEVAIQGLHQQFLATTGSVEKGAESYAFVRAESDRLGLSLRETAGQFALFAAGAKGTKMEGEGVRKLFSQIAEASAVLHLTVDQNQSIFKAFTDMMAKGVVNSQDLKQQLANTLPGAVDIFSRALGVGQAQLFKMMEANEVLSKDALPKVGAELERTFGVNSQTRIETLQGKINRLNSAFFEMKQHVAEDTGLVDAFSAVIESAAKHSEGLANAAELGIFVGIGKALSGAAGLTNSYVESVKKKAEATAQAALADVFQKEKMVQTLEVEGAQIALLQKHIAEEDIATAAALKRAAAVEAVNETERRASVSALESASAKRINTEAQLASAEASVLAARTQAQLMTAQHAEFVALQKNTLALNAEAAAYERVNVAHMRPRVAAINTAEENFEVEARRVAALNAAERNTKNLTTATKDLAAAEVNLAQKVAATSAMQRAAAVAGAALSNVWNLLGGWYGLALAASLGVMKFSQSLVDNARAADAASDALDKLESSQRRLATAGGMTKSQIQVMIDADLAKIAEAQKKIEELAKTSIIDPMVSQIGGGGGGMAALGAMKFQTEQMRQYQQAVKDAENDLNRLRALQKAAPDVQADADRAVALKVQSEEIAKIQRQLDEQNAVQKLLAQGEKEQAIFLQEHNRLVEQITDKSKKLTDANTGDLLTESQRNVFIKEQVALGDEKIRQNAKLKIETEAFNKSQREANQAQEKAQRDLQSMADRITKANETPEDKRAQGMSEAQRAFEAGAITEQTMLRETIRLQAEYNATKVKGISPVQQYIEQLQLEGQALKLEGEGHKIEAKHLREVYELKQRMAGISPEEIAQIQKLTEANQAQADANEAANAARREQQSLEREGLRIIKQLRPEEEARAHNAEAINAALKANPGLQQEATAALKRNSEEYQKFMDLTQGAASLFSDFAEGVIFDSKNMGDALMDLVREVEKLIFKLLVLQPLEKAIGAGFDASGTGGGSFWSGLTGSLFSAGVTAAAAGAGGGGAAAAAGGFAWSTGTPFMAGRGLPPPVVSEPASTTINIHDNRTQGGELQSRESTGPNGEKVIDMMILDAVDRGMARGRFDSTLNKTHGLNRRGNAR